MKDFYLRLSRRALSPGGIRVLALMFFVICLSGRANADETTTDTAYYDWNDDSLYNLYNTSQGSSVTFENGSTVWNEDADGNKYWKIAKKALGDYTYALYVTEGASGLKNASVSFPVAACDSCVVTFQMATAVVDEGSAGLRVKNKNNSTVTNEFVFDYNEETEGYDDKISTSELNSYTFTYEPEEEDTLYLCVAELGVYLYSVTVITYGSKTDEDSEPTVAITVNATNPENEDTVETLSAMEFSLSEEAVVVDSLIDDIMIYCATTREVWYVDTIYINEKKLYITLTDTIDDNINIRTVLPKGLLYNETNNTINGDTVFYYTVGTYASGITFTVEPEEGKVDSLTSFKLTWGDDVTSVGVNYSDGTYPYIKNANGTIQTWKFDSPYEDGTTDGYIGFDWNNWVFDGYVLLTLEDAITEAGTYTLVFPEGTFLYNDEDGNESTAASYEYVIELAPADTTLTLTALETEDGDTVEYIYELQYSAGDAIYLNDSLVGSIIVSNGTDTYTVDTAYISNDTVLYIVLSDTITAEGTVTVTLPAALVGDETAYNYDFVSGNVSAEATFSYIVEAPDEGEIWSLSGDINSWSDASGSGYEFTYEGDGVYTLSLETLSGSFKLRKDYGWDDQYGTNGNTINVGETYTLSAGGDNISITDSPELLGVTLTFTIGDSEATLLIEADSVAAIDYSQYSWSLCGEINSWSESDTTYDFTANNDKTFTLTLDSIDTSAFKLVADHSWDVNFGGDGTAVTIDTAYTLVLGSSNNLWMDSTYTNVTMTLDCSVESPTLTVTVEEEATDSTETEEEETEEEESEDTDEEGEDTDDESDDSDSDDTESGTGSGDSSDSESEDEEDDSEGTDDSESGDEGTDDEGTDDSESGDEGTDDEGTDDSESDDEGTEDEETDGISNVNVENNGTYNVYTITGTHVMKTTDKSDFNSLPKGIYIVNGKKIAIK